MGPDGVRKHAMLINSRLTGRTSPNQLKLTNGADQFPGPTIEAGMSTHGG